MNAQKTHTTVIQLSGQVSNLVITPTQGEFEFEQIDNVMFPVIAPATLAMGSLDVLPSQMRSSMVSKSTNAEYVEFDLGDKHCRGLTRKCFCKDGDTVNVVARVKDEHYEIYAIAKPETQIISLYPHCVRWSQILWKQTVRAWIIKSAKLGSVSAVGGYVHATQIATREWNSELSWTVFLTIFLCFILISVWVAFWAKRKYDKEIHFANFADICFETLDFPDPKNIDLNIFNNEYYLNP